MAKYAISSWGSNTLQPETHLDVFKYDYICGNNGNLLFKNAVAKTLDTKDNELEYVHFYNQDCKDISNAYSHNDIDFINNNYDALVLSEADLFNVAYASRLPHFTAALRKIKIPVIMVGVGFGSSLQKEMLTHSPIDSEVKKFVAALLDRSASIGVRGELTRQYLRRLGFSHSDVDVIGCPTMFTNGNHLNISKKVSDERTFVDSLVAFNGSIENEQLARLLHSHENHVFIPQDSYEFFSILFEDISDKSEYYTRLFHWAINPEKVRFFTNVPKWREFFKSVVFSLGTRVHGNLAPIISGTPSYIIVHDARTEELAQYHEIPYAYSITENDTLWGIYERADYTNTVKGHAGRFKRYIDFLKKNGLQHWESPAENTSFEARAPVESFPGAVVPLQACSQDELVGRIEFFLNELSHSKQSQLLASISHERKTRILQGMKKYLLM